MSTLHRYPFLFGAIQMAEAYPSQANKIVTSMHKFVALANTMLKNGTGVEEWTATRWEDFVMVLQWSALFKKSTSIKCCARSCTWFYITSKWQALWFLSERARDSTYWHDAHVEVGWHALGKSLFWTGKFYILALLLDSLFKLKPRLQVLPKVWGWENTESLGSSPLSWVSCNFLSETADWRSFL